MAFNNNNNNNSNNNNNNNNNANNTSNWNITGNADDSKITTKTKVKHYSAPYTKVRREHSAFDLPPPRRGIGDGARL